MSFYSRYVYRKRVSSLDNLSEKLSKKHHSAPLKLRPYGAIQICLLIVLLLLLLLLLPAFCFLWAAVWNILLSPLHASSFSLNTFKRRGLRFCPGQQRTSSGAAVAFL